MLSLSDEDRSVILAVARRGVLNAVQHGAPSATFPDSGVFAGPCGLFVTLHVAGKLRGCLGIIDAPTTLGENLVRCAADSALHDPRFAPLRRDEMEHLEIEVSLLSPLQPIRPDAVVIGKHGLLAERGMRRGLLLPQVATEHHLNREQFLAETCFKAGLPRDAWRDAETKFYGFECIVIAEKTRSQK